MILASDWVAFHADRTPDKLAMVDQHTGQRLTYDQLNDRASRLATHMRDYWGAKAGDRLAILGKNSVEYFVFQFACIKLGAIMLPLNWRLAEQELVFILNNAEATGLVYDNEFYERIPPLVEKTSVDHTLRIDFGAAPSDDLPAYEAAIDQSAPEVVMDPQTTHDTPVIIMYTAGTTGRPKGVIITHGMNFWNAINIGTPTGISHHSTQYVVLPTFHIGGLNLYANPLVHCGGTSIIAREYDPGLTLQTLSDPQQGVTHFFGVPAIYLFLSQHPDFDQADLSHIESWGCGGAPMPASLLKTYSDRNIIIQLGFGMTETSPTVFLIAKRRALVKPTSVGKPLMHTRVRVVDDNLRDVPVGEVGEVVISGPNITPEYWRRPDANQDSFSFDEHGNRWLHSGDAGMIDDEGCIYIVDRYKDMYISGGENVYPAEVEQIIFGLPQVGDVAVIGVPHERWGETGKAIVVLKEGQNLAAEAIIDHCKANLAKFKVPQSVDFIDVLPRNAAGKVLKRELRQQYITEKSS
ncbi:MAG: long-chain fatty acid--CoA ligase [Anaerolineaceae bacterium]|nr:long-chain fatty acid--CoA ligase [Anaerolineaceae bacterium]